MGTHVATVQNGFQVLAVHVLIQSQVRPSQTGQTSLQVSLSLSYDFTDDVINQLKLSVMEIDE